MKQSSLLASRLGSVACLLVLHFCTVTASRADILAGPITNTANGHVYYLLSPTNWPSAEAQAVALGGHLVTINDAAENTWVFNMFASHGGIARTLWLGLNDATQEGNWVWVGGEASTYRKWAPGEPNNGGGYYPNEDQAAMRGPAQAYPDSWNDAPADQAHAAVVEVASVTPAILAGPITNTANGHVYYLLSPTNWPSAESQAVALGGHLVTINDAAENTWVFNTFASHGGAARTLWLGLNDAALEGHWLWVSGEASAYVKWAPGEPNNGGGFYPNEDQAVMRGPAQAYPDSWNDAPADQFHAAVVEVVITAPPTNTGVYDVASGFSTNSNPNGVWSYGSGLDLGSPMALFADRGSWAGLDYWRAPILLGVPGVYRNPANITVTNGTGTAILGPGQLSFYPGPHGEVCIIRFTAPISGLYQVSGAFTGVDPHGTTTDVHVLVNGVNFNGSVNGYGAGSGPSFNLIVDLSTGDPIDFAVGRSTNSQFSFDSTGLSVQITGPTNAPPARIAPTINSQPQDRTATAGTNVSFIVSATGSAPLSYQWRRNGTNLPGATSPLLLLVTVQPANAGTYSVRVTNAFGSVTSSNAVLTVLPSSTNCVTPPSGLVSWWRAEDIGLVTFDDLPATASGNNWALIPQGYAGLQWNNFGVLNGLSRPPTEGYRTGTVSPQNVAFNLSGDPAFISRPTPFTLKSAYVTAAFVNELHIGVVGWMGTTLVHSNSYTLSTTAPTLLTFNYVGVDRVTFTPSVHSGFFALDDLLVGDANSALDSADGNHGTLAGNTRYGAGRVGQAFVFDGNGDGVRIGNPTNLQLQNFTIEAWIKRASSSTVSLSSGGAFAEFLCYGTGGYAFGFLSDGRLFLSKVDIDETHTSVGITDTNFHHVAVTKSGSTVVFYIDGTAHPAPPYNTTYTFATPAAIGARGDNLDASLYGVIDELTIYNRALGSNELAAIHAAGSIGKCPASAAIPPTITSQPQSLTVNAGANVTFSVTATGTTPLGYLWRRNETNIAGAIGTSLTLSNVQPANAGSYSVRVSNAFGAVASSNAMLTVLAVPTNCVSAPDGLVSWWRAESNALDSVHSNHGTLAGNATFGAGRVGEAFVFDGNGDGVRIGNPTNLQLQNFTIEAWVKRLSTSLASLDPVGGQILSFGNGGYTFGMLNNGKLHLSRTDISNVTMTNGISDTNWHHVAVAKSGSAVVFYIDGAGYPVPAYDAIFTFGSSGAIGARGDNLGNSFLGIIDDISFYSRALSSNAVQAIYQAGSAGKCVNVTPPVGGILGIASLMCEPGSSAKLCFAGVSGNTYIVQASTNLIDWEVVGVSVAGSNGACEFTDPDATKFPCRYYRVVTP